MNYTIINCTQGTEEWLKARAGCVSGTRLSSVMSSKKETRLNLIYEIIAEKIAPLQETYQSGAMERWHLVETVVKELYREKGIIVEEAWFIKLYEWLWISPDGIIRNQDGAIIKALEIKWPQPKTTVKYWIEWWIPSEYYWQVIHYFIVIDTLESLDFIISNPDIADAKYRTKIVTVTRQELASDISRAEEALAEFYGEYTEMIQIFLSIEQ